MKWPKRGLCGKDQSSMLKLQMLFYKTSTKKNRERVKGYWEWGHVVWVWLHGVCKCTQLNAGLMFPVFFSPSQLTEEFRKMGTANKQTADGRTSPCQHLWNNTKSRGLIYNYYPCIVHYLTFLYKHSVRDFYEFRDVDLGFICLINQPSFDFDGQIKFSLNNIYNIFE